MIPRTPPALRRRLDRLARRAHAFHRYAHHPLCVEYAGERIQVGRIRLCRGCALLAVGVGAGLLLGAFLPAHGAVAGVALALAALAGICAFALRLPKMVGRALPGVALAFALVQGLRLGPSGWMLSAASVALFLAAFLLYRRRGPHRGPCETCPERDRRPACRGFAPILRRERALQRLGGRLIARARIELR
ncbi:MAG TPA: hypothetical protein VFF76_07375 [Holophagaceae bacterium]|nr:hypothetical protein [Holophagaceae bacterium]